MLETIKFGGSEFNPLAIIVYTVIVIILLVNLKNTTVMQYKIHREQIDRERELRKSRGQRLRCLDCPYCHKRLHRPFYNSNVLANYEPKYCKKFKIHLPLRSTPLLCQAKDPDKAMREKK